MRGHLLYTSKKIYALIVVLGIAFVGLSGCLPMQKQPRQSTQLEIRARQSKTFDHIDTNIMMRAVIATLQDFHFIVEDSNSDLGVITAMKLENGKTTVTVTVRQWSNQKTLVRVNAVHNDATINNPKMYQNFFHSLSKTLMIDDMEQASSVSSEKEKTAK